MKNIIIFFGCFLMLTSCHQAEKNKLIEKPVTGIKTDSVDINRKSLSNLSDTLVLNLKIDSNRQHLPILLNITAGKVLNASLSSADSTANIRINQVQLPDSSWDGPFGKELHYKMKTPGNYKIVIGENMMAADEWSGDFILRVWVR